VRFRDLPTSCFPDVIIAEAIAAAAKRLADQNIENARLDAEVLLAHVLGRDRAWVVAHFPDLLDDGFRSSYKDVIERRMRREPLQYITGTQEFWGLPFRVTPDVLIPRPETELIVEETVRRLLDIDTPLMIDLCTGSGCVAVSLAQSIPQARIFATDNSAAALEVARENARWNGVADRIRFVEGDLFGPLEELDLGDRVHVITANPPYVRDSERLDLQHEVRDFEPGLALFAGPRGTEISERIIDTTPHYLRPGGSLIMEMGIGQAAALKKTAERTGAFFKIDIFKDLAGIERVLVAKKH
jgi:release factor glutamine methyltransferase